MKFKRSFLPVWALSIAGVILLCEYFNSGAFVFLLFGFSFLTAAAYLLISFERSFKRHLYMIERYYRRAADEKEKDEEIEKIEKQQIENRIKRCEDARRQNVVPGAVLGRIFEMKDSLYKTTEKEKTA